MKSTRKNDKFAVILAGGKGERFWPLSREARPKQFLKLLGKRSFLQQTVARIEPLVPPENIFVITNKIHVSEVRRQLPQIPGENVIGEPVGRDTCAAVALGAALVGYRSTTAVMAVLPADHVIADEATFRSVLADSFAVAGREQVLVTVGIRPAEPATGYGYIRLGQPLELQGCELKTRFHKAEQFVEKPDYDTAVQYLNSGLYRWNAGMFIWSFAAITEGLRQHVPEIYAACRRWFELGGSPRRLARALASDYPALKKISIDYALMEKAGNVIVAEGDFGWDDVGSWPSVAKYLATDAGSNAVQGEFVWVDSARNIVFDARSKPRQSVVGAVGVTDTIVVLTDDAVLIANRGQAQKIKQLVQKLSEHPRYKRLV